MTDRYKSAKDSFYMSRYVIVDTFIELLTDEGDFIEFETVGYSDNEAKADLISSALNYQLENSTG